MDDIIPLARLIPTLAGRWQPLKFCFKLLLLDRPVEVVRMPLRSSYLETVESFRHRQAIGKEVMTLPRTGSEELRPRISWLRFLAAKSFLFVVEQFRSLKKERAMMKRFVFVALMSGFAFLSANIAVANVGDPLDVNKDGIIDDTDVDIVILHINTYGNGTDSLDDGLAEFDPWDDEDIRDLIEFLGSAEPVLYDIATIAPSSDDEERINYMVTWERKDVNDDGFISPADALAIINWLNSH